MNPLSRTLAQTILAVRVCSGAITLAAATDSLPPAPCGAVPSQRQLAWHELEFYGFIHFTVNTFTDREWGKGDEDPQVFNPTALDARQWARVARDAGMKGLILTAKHHDGFCLWPSRYTEHSVKNSPWRGGKGDVVKDLAAACGEYGLKFGVYLSPWDRNHADYGKPEYLAYYRNQLRELLTNYGPIFEVWFDGANGGDGYYGGARERRIIDAAKYYDWANTHQLVRTLQPGAVMFSDAGPDVRWVGNERGVCFETTWLPINLEGLYPGHPDYAGKFAAGQPNGTNWVPPEVDVSIRPGWFYHSSEDAKVKSAKELLRIYYESVGRSGNLLLNLPPDRRGLIHEKDVESLKGFRALLDTTFAQDFAAGAQVQASTTRGTGSSFAAGNVTDGNKVSYWAAAEGVTEAKLELELKKPARFDQVLLQEHVALGQRIEAWSFEAELDGRWRPIASGTTVGHERIARFAPITAERVRVNVIKSRVCPTLARVALFLGAEE
jgi:alpha-L-fucosidase